MSASSTIDIFGITEIYPTKNNGRTWHNKWGSNSVDMHYTSGQADKNDTEVFYHGNGGSFTIYGKSSARVGQAEMHGKTPRVYIRTNNKQGYNSSLGLQKWGSCEITVYTYLTDYKGESYGTGITAGCFTNHIPDSFPPYSIGDFSSQAYYGKLYGNNGACCFKKEVGFPNTLTLGKTTYPFSNGGKMALNTWIGFKFVCRAYTNSIKAHMEIWMDLTNGANGGHWVLVNEIDDVPDLTDISTPVCSPSHDWSLEKPPGTLGSFWHNKPLVHQFQTANYSVLLRNDNTDLQYFKNFSVREVTDIVG